MVKISVTTDNNKQSVNIEAHGKHSRVCAEVVALLGGLLDCLKSNLEETDYKIFLDEILTTVEDNV